MRLVQMLGSGHVHKYSKYLRKQCGLRLRQMSKKIIVTWFCVDMLLRFRNSKLSQTDGMGCRSTVACLPLW